MQPNVGISATRRVRLSVFSVPVTDSMASCFLAQEASIIMVIKNEIRCFILQSLALLAFNSCYARKNLAFDGLKQGTTTSRDVRYLICQTELGAACYRITTANQ